MADKIDLLEPFGWCALVVLLWWLKKLLLTAAGTVNGELKSGKVLQWTSWSLEVEKFSLHWEDRQRGDLHGEEVA